MFSGRATADLSVLNRLREQTRIAAVGLCKRAAKSGAEAGRDRARALAPVGTYYTAQGTKTGGRLKREITVVFDRALPFGEQWELLSPTPYARYVEYDTAPHTILPRRGNFLRWYGPSGSVHFAREVHHPGTTAQPFMGPGSLVAEQTMMSIIEDGWARIGARWR